MMQFLRFAAVGVLNSSVDFAIYVVLTLLLDTTPLLANIMSYSCGVATSFVGNGRVTFRGDGARIGAPWLRFAAFYGANLAGLLMASALVLLLEPWLGPVAAKALSIPPTMIFNFVIARRILSSSLARQ